MPIDAMCGCVRIFVYTFEVRIDVLMELNCFDIILELTDLKLNKVVQRLRRFIFIWKV